MTETRVSIISKNYAKALLDIAKETNSYDYINSQLAELDEVLNLSEDLRIVMANSSISALSKSEILNSVFGGKIDEKLLRFLKVLIEKNRFGEFESIKQAYCDMVEKLSNKKTVEVFSAVKLNFENKSNILFKLERKLNCEVTPVWEIDESLIAGLAFKYDDCVIDMSLRAKLESLSKGITR